MSPERSICILPELTGLGGPASFQSRLKAGLLARGWKVVHNPAETACSAVLVIGGPRRFLPAVFAAQKHGLRIVQRLNGMNWIHRRRWSGLRYYLNAELNNLTIAFIRRKADRVIYQSQFARSWWERVYGQLEKPQTVIFNGVDLNQFSPVGSETTPENCIRMLLVEGHLSKGFELGVTCAVAAARELEGLLNRQVELVVAGDAPGEVHQKWTNEKLIRWVGVIPRDQVPALDRSAHLLFSADLNAACPNSVVEALACGLPVAAFSTGALPEMVTSDAGVIAPYGGDPWKLDFPNVRPLAEAACDLVRDQEHYRRGARARAVAEFDLEDMADRYLEYLVN